MMDRHPVNGSQTIVISEVKDNNVENQRRMGGLDLMLRSEIKRDTVFPFLQFSVKIADGVQQFSIRLLRCLGGVKAFVHPALDSCKSA